MWGPCSKVIKNLKMVTAEHETKHLAPLNMWAQCDYAGCTPRNPTSLWILQPDCQLMTITTAVLGDLSGQNPKWIGF